MTTTDRERLDRILASIGEADDTREGVLAREVRRLRAEGDRLFELADRDGYRADAAEIAMLRWAYAAGVRRFNCAHRPEHYALVTPSARPDCPAGAWQVTRFDSDGPMGHTFAAPGEALAMELVALGFVVPEVDGEQHTNFAATLPRKGSVNG